MEGLSDLLKHSLCLCFNCFFPVTFQTSQKDKCISFPLDTPSLPPSLLSKTLRTFVPMCHCEVVELFAVVDALFTQLCPLILVAIQSIWTPQKPLSICRVAQSPYLLTDHFYPELIVGKKISNPTLHKHIESFSIMLIFPSPS